MANQKWRQLWPYLIIAIVAVVEILPQILTKSYIVGIDSIFHMNRFYDAAMQIKTGHFNYFQSFFGYQQTGRVINALYGPLFAYFNGILLLIAGTWFKFQLLTSWLYLSISGWLMYRLAIKNRVAPGPAVVVSAMYLLSSPMLSWVSGTQFTGLGAMFTPLVMLAGTNMMRRDKITVIPLALSMTLVIQMHLMTSIICATALIPFFIVAFIYSHHRGQLCLDLLKAVGLTLLLTANVWGAMLELFKSNTLLPVAPQLVMSENAFNVINTHSYVLVPVYTILYLLVTIYVVKHWRQLNLFTKVIFGNSMLFLWLSSYFFPWNWIQKMVPGVAYYIQMPARFYVVSFALLFLMVGIILTHQAPHWLQVTKWWLATLAFLGIFGVAAGTVILGTVSYHADRVVDNPTNLKFHTKRPQKLRAALHSAHLKTALTDMTKSTPDYLPIKRALAPDQYFPFHPYHAYTVTAIKKNHHHVRKQVTQNGLRVTWVNSAKHAKMIRIPVFKYAHTSVARDGKPFTAYRTSKVGALIVKSHPGKNHLTIGYRASRWFKALILIQVLGVIGLIGLLGYRGLKNNHQKS
ncbi:hypothetical protein MOO44_04695 [Nicoliella spurrieriana]|uniref:Uncharacterized protein n=1 Tax=Nicoliella spurrieriana TaxID=2925830 RepID=A0A976RTU7_9LACO|nr:hypothetical protein [Nicoliella spurrieriana]UQS87456.1 hypothetical protein MOO44_04695 [Nicoliella spurrieriana]